MSVFERHLSAEDRFDARLQGGARKPHGAVQAVMIGERAGRIPQARRLPRQFFGVTGAIQKGEIRMTVQFDVIGRHGSSWFDPARAFPG